MGVDFGRANPVPRSLALHIIGNRTVLGTTLNFYGLCERRNRRRIGCVDPVLEALPGHDSVQGPRVNMQVAELPTDNARNTAFPRPARSVYRYDIAHISW